MHMYICMYVNILYIYTHVNHGNLNYQGLHVRCDHSVIDKDHTEGGQETVFIVGPLLKSYSTIHVLWAYP